MCENEGLVLYAETRKNYQQYLVESGFSQIVIEQNNKAYAKYNDNIVSHLLTKAVRAEFIQRFGHANW